MRAPEIRPRRAFLKWIYGGISGLTGLVLLATHLVAYSPETAFLWELITRLDLPGALARIVISLFWIHAAWTDVPVQTQHDLRISPGKALGFLFVPFVNLYWTFAMPWRLCTAIDRVLVEAGRARAAPFAVALLAPTLNVLHAILTKTTAGVPVFLTFVATSALWFLFMVRCDRARAGMLHARQAK